MPYLRHLTVAVFAFVLAACASVEPPNELAASAQANVEQAQAVGAHEYAPVALRNAQVNLEKAKEAMTLRDFPKAERLYEKAIADADLAITQANSERMQIAAREIQQNLEVLGQQLNQQ